MAILTIRQLSEWFHNIMLCLIFYFADFQKMVTVVDYEYYKSRAILYLFGLYSIFAAAQYLVKTIKAKKELDLINEKLKSQKELTKYIEVKKKKLNERQKSDT